MKKLNELTKETNEERQLTLYDLNWFVNGFAVAIHKSTHIIDYIHCVHRYGFQNAMTKSKSVVQVILWQRFFCFSPRT